MGQPGRLVTLRAGTPANYLSNPPGLQLLTYSYDAAGNVLSIVDSKADGGTQTQSFSYDALDRLLSASVSGGTGGLYSESYVYNANGLLTTGPLGAGYTYGNTAHQHAVTAVGSNTFTYDANGNLSTRTVGGQGFNLFYDGENRLVTVNGPTSGALSMMATISGSGARWVASPPTTWASTTKWRHPQAGPRWSRSTTTPATPVWRCGMAAPCAGCSLTTWAAPPTPSTAPAKPARCAIVPSARVPFGRASLLAPPPRPIATPASGKRPAWGCTTTGQGGMFRQWAQSAIQPNPIIPQPGSVLDYHRYAYTRFKPLKV